MAQVFLSYDREDAAKARAIAQALERAGHLVWWDLHIKGGAEYGKAIEQALEAADAVIVLWSTHSIDSAWVRDEAAAGRDKSCLIPVLLDQVSPPMGFRQYQGIDLSGWAGRRRPKLQAVLAAIDEIVGARPASQASNTNGKNARPPTRTRHRLAILVLALAIFIAAAVTALWWRPWRPGGEAPLVAVVPASAGQPAKELSSDLLIKLGVLQSAHADAIQLVEIDSPQKPDFVIKVASSGASQAAAANIALMDNRTGALLWSREFSDPGGKQADLRQQMAYSAAQVLDCAMQAATDTAPALKLPTLKLYLSGCADLSNLLAQDPGAAAALFLKVTEQAPKFEGGWKKLLLADIQAFRFSAGGERESRLKIMSEHAAQGRRLDPAMAEAYLAEALTRPPGRIIEFMNAVDRAVAADPDNSEILSFRSIALTNVGMIRQSLADTRRAVNLNPLSPAGRDALIVALLNNGEVEAAKAELAKAERLWPGATTVLQSRFAVEFREGNPALALRMMKSGDLGAAYTSSDPAHESYLRARIDPSMANRQQAISSARTLYRQDPTAAWVYIRALSEFGGHDALVAFLLGSDASTPYRTTWVLFRRDFADLHHDPRFMRIAERFRALDYWRGTGKWPDFCFDPDLPYDCKAEAAKLS